MIHGKQIQNNSVDVNKLIVSDNSVLNLTDNSFILSGDSVTTSFNTVSGLEVNFPNAPIGKKAIESSLVSQIAFAATFDSSITSLTQVEDGKLLVFGSFTQSNGVSANGLVKLNADGTTDTAFDIGTGPNSTIFEVLWDGSKYYVAGTFSSFNGSSVAGLVRLNVDGSIDNTFVAPTGNTSGVVKCAIQSDSKIVVCGEGISGQVLRLNTDGSIDGSFDIGTGFLGGGVTDLLIQTGDKLIVIGSFATYSGNSYTTNIIRINSDGSVDSDFMNNVGTGCGNPPQKLFDFDNDEFVLTMNSASYNGGPASAVKIINYEGIEDTTFATNYTNEGNANADDIGVVPGACVFSYQQKGNIFKKHNVDGTVDSSYTPSASGYQPMVGVQENGDNFVFFGSFSGLQKYNVDTPTEATVDVPSIVSEVIFEYNNDYTSRFGKYSLVDNNYVTGNTWLNGGETILGETTDIRVGAEGEFLPTMLTMSVTEIEGGLGGNSLTLKSQNSEYEFSISGVHGGNHGMFLGTSASKFIFLAGSMGNSIKFYDIRENHVGLEYYADYSSGFTKHSMVDVNYVTGITSTISANVANGLSKDAGTIVLGGSLLNDTDITATGSTHTSTISLGKSAFNAAFGVSTEYNDGFTMGSTTFEVKHFNGTVMTFDDLNGGWNEFKVGSSGIEATSNGNNFGRYSLLDVSNANQYGKPDEQPQVFQQIVEDDGTVNDVLFSPYGFDVTMRNADDDDLAKFVITKTGTTFTDGRAVKAGIEYKGDYSTGFTKHSLVDVNYVTGITSSLGSGGGWQVSGTTTLVEPVYIEGPSGQGVTMQIDSSPLQSTLLLNGEDSYIRQTVTSTGAAGTIRATGGLAEIISQLDSNNSRLNFNHTTGAVYTQGGATTGGIRYNGDYSSGFVKHSIVDVNYVTGITSQISTALVVTSSGIAGDVVADLSSADIFLLSVTGNVTSFNFTGETIGKQYMFKFIQDTTNKSFTWASGRYRFPFGNAPVLTNPTTNGSSPAHSEDIITAICMSSGRLDVVITPDLIEN